MHIYQICFRLPNILEKAEEIRIGKANIRHFDDIDIDSKLEKILTAHHVAREKFEHFLNASTLVQKYGCLTEVLFEHPDIHELYDIFADFDAIWSKSSNKQSVTKVDQVKRQIILIRNSTRKNAYDLELELEPETFNHFSPSKRPLLFAEYYCHLYKSQKVYTERCNAAKDLWQILEEHPSLEFPLKIYQIAGQMFSDIRSPNKKGYFSQLFPLLIQKFHENHLHNDCIRLILTFCPSNSSKKLNPVPPQQKLRELKPIWKSIFDHLIGTLQEMPENRSNLKTLLSFVEERHIFDLEYLSDEEISDHLELIKKLIISLNQPINEAGEWIKKLCRYPQKRKNSGSRTGKNYCCLP